MGHLNLSEMKARFVKIQIAARCYNQIFTMRGYAKLFCEEFKLSEDVLGLIQPEEWMHKFKKLQDSEDLKAMQAFLQEDYKHWFTVMTDSCRELLKHKKTIDVLTFNSAINQMFSFIGYTDLSEEQTSEAFMLAEEVLALYPDNGYNPETDAAYEEKVLNGSIVYGDRELRLREKQVRAEQNSLLKI